MNNEYNIRDKVWIHIGERRLVEGRVVDIINLAHLGEGHDPKNEIYIIEIKTGIEDIFEARRWNEISPDARGPINLFRKNNVQQEQRYLKKVGVILPIEGLSTPLEDILAEHDPNEPTAEQITAALERSEQSAKHQTMSPDGKPKRRTFKKKKTL